MRRLRVLPVFLFVFGLFLAPLNSSAATPDSFADLAEKLLPSVVNISTTQKIDEKDIQNELEEVMPQLPPGSPFEDFFRDFMQRQGPGQPMAPRKSTSLGSGVIIDAAGYVITNNHVIQDADEITVILNDNSTLKAELVGRDEKTDLALLKVKSDAPLAAARFGNSDAMRVGDWVVAIGNPFGLGGTVTAGIISARARDINSGPYDDYLQTDAPINRGNSGGPMFNMRGEIIGINTAIFSPTGGSIGIGFAIPANIVQPVVTQLKDFGRTRRGWLGVRIQSVTDEIAASLGLGKAQGALVSSVSKDGPADKAGLQAGDVILTFNGKEISEMRRLPLMVAETPVDSKAELGVWRKGKSQRFTVTVGELESAEESGEIEVSQTGREAPEDGSLVESFGLTVTNITPELRQRYRVKSGTGGVLVLQVTLGGPAVEAGFQSGDVILEADQTPVANVTEFRAAADKAQGRDKPLLLLVEREGDLRFIALKPQEKKTEKKTEKKDEKKGE